MGDLGWMLLLFSALVLGFWGSWQQQRAAPHPKPSQGLFPFSPLAATHPPHGCRTAAAPGWPFSPRRPGRTPPPCSSSPCRLSSAPEPPAKPQNTPQGRGGGEGFPRPRMGLSANFQPLLPPKVAARGVRVVLGEHNRDGASPASPKPGPLRRFTCAAAAAEEARPPRAKPGSVQLSPAQPSPQRPPRPARALRSPAASTQRRRGTEQRS